ncbi:MAG TPA: hypothetical protein IAB48_09450 [Candidatus Fimimorpha excrementavium]|nr:hypothetical protein [Candidatus Fimimorpha excrementavium]
MDKGNVEHLKPIAETVLDYWYTIEFLGQDAIPELTYEEKKKIQEAEEGKEKSGRGGERTGIERILGLPGKDFLDKILGMDDTDTLKILR